MTRAADLRALDGRLCRLSEELRNPALPESARPRIDAEVAELMARRAALTAPAAPRAAPGPLFVSPPALADVDS